MRNVGQLCTSWLALKGIRRINRSFHLWIVVGEKNLNGLVQGMKLSELFNEATKGWPADEVEIMKNDIKAQLENRANWIETLKGLIEFEK